MTRTFHPLVLGILPSPLAYLKAIRSLPGHQVGEWTETFLLRELTCASAPREIDVATLAYGDLGLERYAPHDAVMDRVLAMGYEPCPAEVGPALCLLSQQLPVEDLFVAMRPIHADDGMHVLTIMRFSGHKTLGTWFSDDWTSQKGRVVVALPSAVVTL